MWIFSMNHFCGQTGNYIATKLYIQNHTFIGRICSFYSTKKNKKNTRLQNSSYDIDLLVCKPGLSCPVKKNIIARMSLQKISAQLWSGEEAGHYHGTTTQTHQWVLQKPKPTTSLSCSDRRLICCSSTADENPQCTPQTHQVTGWIATSGCGDITTIKIIIINKKIFKI